jgi:hypothetical protein
MRTRRSIHWLAAVSLLAASSSAAEEGRGWSIFRRPPLTHAYFMTDSAYQALSAVPIDSLTERQFDLLMRERQLRAELGPEPRKGHAILMSDHEYVALSREPVDSLSDRQYELLSRELAMRTWLPPKPREGFPKLPKDTYAKLSALPIDSLSTRQYDLLIRERQLRAPQAEENSVVGLVLFISVLGAFAAGAWLTADAFTHALAAW